MIANNGSSLLRERPASCDFDNNPDSATLVNKPASWMSLRSVLTATLFPTESTSSRILDSARSGAAGDRCVWLLGANAEAEAKKRAATSTWNFIVVFFYLASLWQLIM